MIVEAFTEARLVTIGTLVVARQRELVNIIVTHPILQLWEAGGVSQFR